MNKLFVVLFVAGAFCAAGYAAPGLGSALSAAASTNDLRSTIDLALDTPSGIAAALVPIIANLPTTLGENSNRTIALLAKVGNGSVTVDDFLTYLLTGVYIATSTDTSTTNSAGGLGLPTATLCKLKAQYAYTSCYICNEDCYVAHNLWGGGCGPSPITGQPTCLCADSAEEATARNLTVNSRAACGVFNPAAGLESALIAIAFRLRYIGVQCIAQTDGSYDSTGCNVDCVQNHGMVRGDCQVQMPNVDLPVAYISGNENPQVFCICSHDNSPNTTFALPYNSTNVVTAGTNYVLPAYTSSTAAPASS